MSSSSTSTPSEYSTVKGQFEQARAKQAQQERELVGREQQSAVRERQSGRAARYAEARFTVTQGLLVGFLGVFG